MCSNKIDFNSVLSMKIIAKKMLRSNHVMNCANVTVQGNLKIQFSFFSKAWRRRSFLRVHVFHLDLVQWKHAKNLWQWPIYPDWKKFLRPVHPWKWNKIYALSSPFSSKMKRYEKKILPVEHRQKSCGKTALKFDILLQYFLSALQTKWRRHANPRACVAKK